MYQKRNQWKKLLEIDWKINEIVGGQRLVFIAVAKNLIVAMNAVVIQHAQ